MADLYRVLQVDPSADAEVVEAAYRRLARKFHPDVSGRPDAEARIRDLNAAYEVLGDPSRRAAYDLARAAPPAQRTRVRVVAARPRPAGRAAVPPGVAPPTPAAPRVGGSEEDAGRRPPSRPVLAATMAGVAATVALAALSSQLFSPQHADGGQAPAAAVVIVSSPREEPALFEPPPRRATPTPSGWPPPIYVVEGAETKPPPAVDLFSRFVGAARHVTRRLQGPTPPERPYNPVAP